VATKRRPPGYRAPSWSWACLDDRIKPHFHHSGAAKNHRLQILELAIQLATPKAVYGSVTSAQLVVKGRFQHPQFMIWPAAHRVSTLKRNLKHPDFEGLEATLEATSPHALDESLTADDDGFVPVVCLEVGSGLSQKL
jgi:hypothetical protein